MSDTCFVNDLTVSALLISIHVGNLFQQELPQNAKFSIPCLTLLVKFG